MNLFPTIKIHLIWKQILILIFCFKKFWIWKICFWTHRAYWYLWIGIHYIIATCILMFSYDPEVHFRNSLTSRTWMSVHYKLLSICTRYRTELLKTRGGRHLAIRLIGFWCGLICSRVGGRAKGIVHCLPQISPARYSGSDLWKPRTIINTH